MAEEVKNGIPSQEGVLFSSNKELANENLMKGFHRVRKQRDSIKDVADSLKKDVSLLVVEKNGLTENVKNLSNENENLKIKNEELNEKVLELTAENGNLQGKLEKTDDNLSNDFCNEVLHQNQDCQKKKDEFEQQYKTADSLYKESKKAYNQYLSLYNSCKKDSIVVKTLTAPCVLIPVSAILIALIIAVTMIALRKGFTFTKGNTTVSVGRTRTKKKKAD